MIDQSKKTIKILFVCLGNICRSPLAEGIFKNLLEKENLTESFFVHSAGTGHWHIGEAPDIRTQQTAAKHGLDISQHKGQQVHARIFQEYDYVIAMDKDNERILKNMSAQTQNKHAQILMMRQFDPMAPTKDAPVPDPYYGGIDGFEKVYAIIERSCKQLLEEILKNQSSP